MIRAMVFDLDRTLVKTEWLKSLSYAQAVQRLSPASVTVEQVQAAFSEVVGRSREEVSMALLARFELEAAAQSRLADFNVRLPWQVLASLRLKIYETMLADASLLRANQWPYNVELLRMARRARCRTGLASMSTREQVHHVLEAIALQDDFDVVLSRDDVEFPKPDPEIYRLASRRLELQPQECLVIEDSPVGVAAAVAAGMHCVAVATPFTRAGLRAQKWLPQEWVVEDPAMLTSVVDRFMRTQSGSHFRPDSPAES